MMDVYTIKGNTMYVPEKHIENLKNNRVVLDDNQYDAAKRLSKGTCIDLGGNIGHMTLVMAKNCDKVYTFEPHPENFEVLKANVELNKLNNVNLYNVAVSDFNGVIDLHLCDFNDGMHRVYPSQYCKAGKIEVKAVRVDDIIKEKVDFIKIDIEGAEYPALLGMKNLIYTYKPVVMIEFHPPSIEECGDDPKKVYDFFVDAGYKNFNMADNTKVESYKDLDRLTRNISAMNVICSV